MAKIAPFTFEEANSIYRLAQVDQFMRQYMMPTIDQTYDIPAVSGHSIDGKRFYFDRHLQPWRWLGEQVPLKRFLILRELTIVALVNALRHLEGRELQAVLIRMRMVNADDAPFEHAVAVADGVVDHAVKQQHGASGLKSYHRHMKAQVNKDMLKIERVPSDLDLSPYRESMPLRVALGVKMGGDNAAV
jgi:hypothetical protein